MFTTFGYTFIIFQLFNNIFTINLTFLQFFETSNFNLKILNILNRNLHPFMFTKNPNFCVWFTFNKIYRQVITIELLLNIILSS